MGRPRINDDRLVNAALFLPHGSALCSKHLGLGRATLFLSKGGHLQQDFPRPRVVGSQLRLDDLQGIPEAFLRLVKAASLQSQLGVATMKGGERGVVGWVDACS